MASSGRYARRRRNAILAAAAIAALLLLIIVLIAIGILKRKSGSTSTATPTPTNGSSLILPTIGNNTPTPTIPSAETPTPTGDTAAPTPTATNASSDGQTMYVTGDGVNVRKEASASSDIVTSLAKGTSVTAYEKSGDFWRVKLIDGKTGYMSQKYLSTTRPSTSTPTTAPSATPDTSKSTTMYVKGDSVNVRKEASTSSTAVTRLAKGTKVTAYATVTAGGTQWTYIEYAKGKYGYIASQYLTAETTSNPTPTPTAGNATPTAGGNPTPTPAHATSSADFLPAEIASKFTPITSLLNATKAKMGTLVNVKEGYTVYEVEKLDGTFYYVALKDGGSAAYAFDDPAKIGETNNN